MKFAMIFLAFVGLGMSDTYQCEYDDSQMEQFASCIENEASSELKSALEQAQKLAECDDNACLVTKLCGDEDLAFQVANDFRAENLNTFYDISDLCFE